VTDTAKPLETGRSSVEYRVEEQIGFVLRKVHQRASAIFESVMGEFDVTPMQFTVLIKLDDEGETSQNQLGRLAAMDPATTFGVISRLKKRGFVIQRKDPTDGRRILLDLTQSGQQKAQEMRHRAAEVSAQTLEPLAPDERETILVLLNKMV